MKKNRIFLGLSGICFLLTPAILSAFKPALNATAYTWRKTDSTLALLNQTKVIWQFNFNKKQDKPYFHPLRTTKGYDLTLERPADHPWHRGLWFSWKLINGVNYWEEDPKTGPAAGRSLIRNVKIQTTKNFEAGIELDLEYFPEHQNSPVMTEHRIIKVSAPDHAGNYFINWELVFEAKANLTLDRTPPKRHGGVEWGGYGGLSFRVGERIKEHRFSDSNGWQNKDDLTGYGENADWMDLTARLDSAENAYGGLTILDNRKNRNSPSPWYVWFEKGKHAFFTPALLYNTPVKMAAGKSLRLNYITFIHNDVLSQNELSHLQKALK